ncbi:MAG: hypothetical protein ACKO8Z_16695, partial [Prosthecobacter sp.]
CVSSETLTERQTRATKLAAAFKSLSPNVSRKEAKCFAMAAVERAAQLNREWHPMVFPWMNNLLVNTGLRQHGLCHHWREALFPTLHALHSQTLDLHLASARRATLREHNAIVVTAHGQPFETGVILDGWHGGGILQWSAVQNDRHPWKPLPPELIPIELRPMIMP